MRKLIVIKGVVVFFALLLFSKAGMATAVYSDKKSFETACVIKSSGSLEQNGIVEPVLELESPESSGRSLKFVENTVKSIADTSFSQKKYNVRFFLKYHRTSLYKGISIYLFNCVFII